MQKTFEFGIQLPGGPFIHDVVTAASEYNARQVIRARYPGCAIVIARTVG